MNDREYVLCALSVATRAIENAATALHKQEAREFEDTAQTKGSPKPPSNSAWKLVPVEPTEQMLDAMQESALVSFDAAIEAELNNGPAVESLHRVVYRAMLAAAPEAPSAEPVAESPVPDLPPEVVTDALTQPKQEPVAWTDRELELIDGMIEVQLRHAAQCDAIANRPMAERQKGWDMERVALLQKIKSNPHRREVMRLALEALEAMQSYAAAERKGLRICDEAINALRAAVGEKE
jgi:hypothetical protein